MYHLVSNVSGDVTKDSLIAWFRWLIDYLDRNHLRELYESDPRRVLNCDETPVPAAPKMPKVVAGKKSKHVYKTAQPNNKELYTMLATANASGEFFNPFMVLKGERISEELKVSVPEKIDFTLTKEGYQTAESFLGNILLLLSLFY